MLFKTTIIALLATSVAAGAVEKRQAYPQCSSECYARCPNARQFSNPLMDECYGRCMNQPCSPSTAPSTYIPPTTTYPPTPPTTCRQKCKNQCPSYPNDPYSYECYGRARPRSSPEGAYRTTTGTAFIVEGPDRVHAYLCTTLHTIIDSAGWGYNGAYVRDVEIWIAEDEDRRRDDLFTKFDGLKEYDVSLESRGFQRVEIGSEALDERVEFLKGLEEQKAVENCFLDPEFGLYAVPILDVTFLHLPPTLKMAVESEKIKPLRVATKAPKPGQPFVAIAYHDVEEPMEADVYCSTMPVTLKAKTFIHSGRSCTLGKVTLIFIKSSSLSTV
ncbi:hypothetical protein HK097_001757 [Rhizophlyctis rosea]|uniref:Uncharacterized protein n=1 Tax=Rhizophlyctis rosea TaxID=64517 RepID=A0AAD5SH05_9FUNG|nr:hypothetical protein HK097_001757 [Rhizophlyctis rosea]